ncbi:hypothetical protein [Candidatus Thiodiazotropha sp. CDECU1]|uniref:hypothetical protein n=1 Tax=Candidatus Thiodiazotropha sp. CDECU1 TaxID=3065865 RepID=UPI00292DAA74|nr:hypothetical protein [Candidatus Thiodiazotropha sp. CDECU1]
MLHKIQSTATSFAYNDSSKRLLGSEVESVETPTFCETHPEPSQETFNLLSERLTLRFTKNLTTRYISDNDTIVEAVTDFNLVSLDERNAQDRITLLSRKYARNSLSQEESARLDMLTERLRNLIPEVSESEIARMEHFANTLEEAAQSAKDIADELNITL